ncbi:sulfite exporter TauE/SafE family protein [Sinimarinibacterium sp. NLF-5-8]|uniref:sulfite exporter TauE/SafE family protein n=1 Tax=Sinimarinibacterium sp. NLF-5-8 TaxID=2698684 RepID=UPI00137C0968|nr:sulfite exporter TauE/SafE family protein [Sinimarinibacterium sp. NLF-5-8]QHS09931.1 sulfite exporter TauE/SafE family protein [Sinimarinibacterium sp. NLF-5-8]
MLEQLTLGLVGFAASFFSALAGGGAGLLQFPALILLGLSFAGAVATHKVAVVALGVGSTFRYARAGGMDYRFLTILTLLGLPGVVFGTQLALLVPDRPGVIGFGFVNIGLGLYSIFRPQLGLLDTRKNRSGRGLWIGYALAFAVGWLTGFVPSGPGVFSTLLFLTWFGFDYRRAVAYTMLMVGLVWNSAGAITAAVSGPVQWHWMAALVVGGLLGGYVGANLGLVRGNRFIKRAYESLTLIMGASLIAQGLLS